MNIFFEEGKIDADDACINGDKKDVGIICEFDDLTEELVIDADYATSLKNEHLLNENGLLELHKLYDGSLKTPKLKSILAVAMHPSNAACNDLLLLKNKDLKDQAKKFEINLDGIDQKINSQLRQAKADKERLLRICGYGVPDLQRALYSAANSLTLIAQAELQPYDRKEGGEYRTKEMHLYDLPWPSEVLLDLPLRLPCPAVRPEFPRGIKSRFSKTN